MAVIVWQAAYPVLAACILYEISRGRSYYLTNAGLFCYLNIGLGCLDNL